MASWFYYILSIHIYIVKEIYKRKRKQIHINRRKNKIDRMIEESYHCKDVEMYPIHVAVLEKDLNGVVRLLRLPELPKNAADAKYSKLLAKAKEYVNVLDGEGDTALHICINLGERDNILHVLLEFGADVNIIGSVRRFYHNYFNVLI